MRLAIFLITLLFIVPVQAETLTIIVQNINGQPYYNARLLGKYMVKHYPGATESVVKVVPGGNGINAANFIYNLAPKDGLTFGTFTRSAPLAGLIGGKNIQFETDKFTWLGSTSDGRKNPNVILSHRKYDGSTLNMGEQGTSEGSTIDMIKNMTGWNLKRVSGYKDVPEIRLAFSRKEIDGFFIVYSTLMAGNPEFKPNIIIQYGNGLARHTELKDVPTLMELTVSEDNKKLLAYRELAEIMARPFVAPPQISNEKASLLREAFNKAVHDPEFIEEAMKMSIDVSFLGHKDAEDIILRLKSLGIETLSKLD